MIATMPAVPMTAPQAVRTRTGRTPSTRTRIGGPRQTTVPMNPAAIRAAAAPMLPVTRGRRPSGRSWITIRSGVTSVTASMGWIAPIALPSAAAITTWANRTP